MGEVERMSVGAMRESGGWWQGATAWEGAKRQHMSGARVHRGDKTEGTRDDRLKL